MKLAIFDLDGTLFDTKDINYYAYKCAVEQFGFSLDYDYYCKECNGKYYLDFLPKITTKDTELLKQMHDIKKANYSKFLEYAKPNTHLFELIRLIKREYKIALVTTASKQNCYELLDAFRVTELFDLILTRQDIEKTKPDPEGFLKAMQHFGVKACDTVIFEDSDVGLQAAKSSGASYYKTYGFN